ncbi:Zn-dependent hydrolase [Selenomonas sp. TAMA-11512]|uniref:M20 family metallo-hydrolase n=1 Tax=Selenomonas sp. TAMA-11512 TaxID=3095337 RepID=UPI003092A41B|nr:Zn-dependent hydrolase [Selenomonas sp. TAMA-11512]
MKADPKRLERRLEEIDAFNATPGEGTTREVYTKEFYAARDYLKTEMAAMGLAVREDCVGNIFGCLEGEDTSLAPVWTGSHIDTVPNGGRYDGLAGVFAGLEAVRLLKESGVRLRRTISVNAYAGEEMSRFGMCCIGSRAITGKITAEDLKESREAGGCSIYEALEAAGFHPDRFAEEFPRKVPVHASLELHIEQNRILEDRGIPLGIVTGICAPTNLTVTVTGTQSHAGGTSMRDRRDAFMAAAEISLTLERLARESKSDYITGTVGSIALVPGAANVIPGKAVFSIDIRSVSAEDKDELVRLLREEVKRIQERRGVAAELLMQNNDRPYRCPERMQQLLRAEADAAGIPAMDIISGPYHDSLMLGDITDTGMIFIPCRDGISHDRAEAIRIEDLAAGTDVLAGALEKLGKE